jgi:hypothetical protein
MLTIVGPRTFYTGENSLHHDESCGENVLKCQEQMIAYKQSVTEIAVLLFLTLSMFCGVVILVSGPLHRHDIFPAVLNAFTQFTIDCDPGTCPHGGTANRK